MKECTEHPRQPHLKLDIKILADLTTEEKREVIGKREMEKRGQEREIRRGRERERIINGPDKASDKNHNVV